jgi:hypothetical protein
METYDTRQRPAGAIPAQILSDDEILLAMNRARRERSKAFIRAIQFGVDVFRGRGKRTGGGHA